MRIKRIGLEHHGNAALGRIDIVHAFVANEQIATRYLFQPGDHAQQGGLAAARGADEHDEFLVGNVKINATDHLDSAEGFFHIGQLQTGHGISSARGQGEFSAAKPFAVDSDGYRAGASRAQPEAG